MNIQRKTGLLLLLLICAVSFSCAQSKEHYILSYERYIRSVEKNRYHYTEKDWVKADRKIMHFHIALKRYEKKLSAEEKQRIYKACSIYRSYRPNIAYPLTEKNIIEPEHTPESDKTPKTERIIGPPDIPADMLNTRIEELKRITEQQAQIAAQLEQLRRQIIEEAPQHTPSTDSQHTTEQERLINKMQNDLLMDMLKTKKQGWRDISGKVKVLVVPAHFKGYTFRMNHNHLTNIIQKAVAIILSQARKYNQDLSIDWTFIANSDGSYCSLGSSTEAVDNYKHYKKYAVNYDHLAVVYAVDKTGRSFCSYRGTLGKSTANAVIWFKDYDEHRAGTLAHELFHTFGADDLYYEEGIVPKEVEENFKTLLGNSIMITSQDSAELDPINAWLIGWNKKPEPWYAWFVDRRQPIDTGDLE